MCALTPESICSSAQELQQQAKLTHQRPQFSDNDTILVAFTSKMLHTIVLSESRFHVAQIMLPFFILIDLARLDFSAGSDSTCITPLQGSGI